MTTKYVLTKDDPPGWYQCGFRGSAAIWMVWWEDNQLWNDCLKHSHPNDGHYDFVGPFVPATELAALRALTVGVSCFSCGVLWTPETAKEKCPECHRPDEWSHEWVSPRVNSLTSKISKLQNQLDFLKAKGLTVGTMKEAGKEPYLAYVIEDGSEFSDQEHLDKNLELTLKVIALEKQIKEQQ